MRKNRMSMDEIFRQAYSSDLEENVKNIKEDLGMKYVKNTYKVDNKPTVDQLIEGVKVWAAEREIDKQSADAGIRKVVEELGELSSAYSRNNENDIADSMGDLIVTVVNLSTQMGLNFKDCLALAYDEIKDRNGKVINGTFVKDEDLKNKKDN